MATAAPAPTYASLRNARFHNTQSHLVDLETRLNATIAALPAQAQRNWHASLAKAIKDFKRNHPGVKDFFDRHKFKLCLAQEINGADIMIDTTMQREPDLKWVLHIVANFRAFMAQPIQVFRTADGKWGAWDSQHTALALMLICKHVFGLELKDVRFPANIYDLTNRADLRQLFISLNTTVGKNAGKKPLDIIDIFQQMVYGVGVDGATDPEWVDAWQKQQYVAAEGMFLTADKFNDTNQIGAISRLNELHAASVEVVRQFCVYGGFVVASQQRPINSKEIPIIIEFLNLCEQQDIKYTDEQIEDLAQHIMDLFDANFDAKGPFWDQCHQANLNAYNKANAGIPKHLWPEAPRNNKNTPTGTAFLWHQLQKSWVPQQSKGFRFPKQPYSVYTPDAKDLF
jgi:hypothetical protein